LGRIRVSLGMIGMRNKIRVQAGRDEMKRQMTIDRLAKRIDVRLNRKRAYVRNMDKVEKEKRVGL